MPLFFFFFNDTATTEIYTLSLHDALPIFPSRFHPGPHGLRLGPGLDSARDFLRPAAFRAGRRKSRSEEHTSELQSLTNLVCRLLLEKKKPMRGHAARNKDHDVHRASGRSD